MFCENCGNQIGESDEFCHKCGAKVLRGAENNAPQTPEQNCAPTEPIQKPLGMKWYNFVVRFQLFLGMLFSVYSGYRYFSGNVSGGKENWQMLCSVFPDLKVNNIVFGVICLLCAVFMIIIRHRMVKFKKNAPSSYVLITAIQFALEWIWLFSVAVITGMGFDGFTLVIPTMAGQTLGILVYIVLNIVYFHKRRHLFIN